MAHDLKEYKPDYYDGILEMDVLLEVEQSDFNELWTNLNTMDEPDPDNLLNRGVRDNQFIQTSDDGQLKRDEALFGILAATSESLAFRRARLLNRFGLRPPFSVPWLTQQLDQLIGAGLYTLTVDPNTYTLTVQSAAQNQDYYHEIAATIAYVKPCNMLFINKPLIIGAINTNEGVNLHGWVYAYHLGTTWNLGRKPFRSFEDRGQIVVPGTGSIKSGLLADIAAFTASDVAKVRINGAVVIDTFVTKTSVGGVTSVEYDVTPEQTATITLVELLNADDIVLTSSVVYVPVILGVRMSHVITVKEGL